MKDFVIRKRAAAVILTAVLLCGCKAEESPASPDTAEALRETNAEESAETYPPEKAAESTEAPEVSETIPVETSEMIPVLSEESDEPTVIPPIFDNAEYFSETSFFEGEIGDEGLCGTLYFGLNVPFGLELFAEELAVTDQNPDVGKPAVSAVWIAEELSEDNRKLLNIGSFSEDKLTYDVSREFTNEGEEFYLMVERSFADSGMTRLERTTVSGLYPLERGYFQWLYYYYEEDGEREFISDATNSLKSMIYSPTYYGEPTEESAEASEPQSNFEFTVRLPEGTALKADGAVSDIPNTGLELTVLAISELGTDITVTEVNGEGAWDYALTCAENVRNELDIEGVPWEKLEELGNGGDRVIILKKTPLVEGYLYTVSGFYKRNDNDYFSLFANMSGKDEESCERLLTELAVSFKMTNAEN